MTILLNERVPNIYNVHTLGLFIDDQTKSSANKTVFQFMRNDEKINSMRRALEKLIVAQLIRKFLAFYGT